MGRMAYEGPPPFAARREPRTTVLLREIQHATINTLAADRLVAMESKGVNSGSERRDRSRTINT